jgi:hypothetical protein
LRRNDNPPPGVLNASAAKRSKASVEDERLETVTESVTLFPGVSCGEKTTRGVLPGMVVGYTDQLPLLAAPAGDAVGSPRLVVNTSAPRVPSQGMRRATTQR